MNGWKDVASRWMSIVAEYNKTNPNWAHMGGGDDHPYLKPRTKVKARKGKRK